MTISESVTINKPVSEVYPAFLDIEAIGNRIPGIVKTEVISDTQTGVGTVWKETRVMMGKEVTEQMEVTGAQENTLIEITSNSAGTLYTTEYIFQERDGATEVTMKFSGVAQTFMAKIFTPLAALMAGSMKKMLKSDLESMKQSLEG